MYILRKNKKKSPRAAVGEASQLSLAHAVTRSIPIGSVAVLRLSAVSSEPDIIIYLNFPLLFDVSRVYRWLTKRRDGDVITFLGR